MQTIGGAGGGRGRDRDWWWLVEIVQDGNEEVVCLCVLVCVRGGGVSHPTCIEYIMLSPSMANSSTSPE
jgi:hypothetical protein